MHTEGVHLAKDKQGNWHIRDFGRGLQIEHFTLKEKFHAPSGVIGKFGINLNTIAQGQ